MSIAQNKKAFHDYFIEEKYEAGIVLEGWEVKAIRDNRIQLKEAYVIIQRGEIYLIGCHVTPLGAASTHIRPDAIRTRKLLTAIIGLIVAVILGIVFKIYCIVVPLLVILVIVAAYLLWHSNKATPTTPHIKK